jgi:hypothetical protein
MPSGQPAGRRRYFVCVVRMDGGLVGRSAINHLKSNKKPPACVGGFSVKGLSLIYFGGAGWS